METERGKGEYEARVSGRVNNNARRQMSIPPPLFAWSARRSLIPVPLALLRTSLCRRQRPMSSSNTRLGGPRSTWCGPTPIKHRCFVESPSTGISSFFSFFLSRSLSLFPPPLSYSLYLSTRPISSASFVLSLDRSLTFYRAFVSACVFALSCPARSSSISASIMLQVVRFHRGRGTETGTSDNSRATCQASGLCGSELRLQKYCKLYDKIVMRKNAKR